MYLQGCSCKLNSKKRLFVNKIWNLIEVIINGNQHKSKQKAGTHKAHQTD